MQTIAGVKGKGRKSMRRRCPQPSHEVSNCAATAMGRATSSIAAGDICVCDAVVLRGLFVCASVGYDLTGRVDATDEDAVPGTSVVDAGELLARLPEGLVLEVDWVRITLLGSPRFTPWRGSVSMPMTTSDMGRTFQPCCMAIE
jgi:hypothetical protein